MTAIKKIETIVPPWPFEAYAHTVSPLPAKDGGGFLITFPDLPGCVSDDETEAEAVENGRDAFLTFVSALADMGQDVPAPSAAMDLATPLPSGKFITRVPKSIHARLAERAKAEGVSLDTLVLSLISKGLGKRAAV